MPMAPQLLPVENAVKADRTNTEAGSSGAGRLAPRLAIRNSAVFSSLLISAMDHASTNMIMATKVKRAPEIQASTISSRLSSRCRLLMMTAVNADSREAHIKAR